MRKKSRASDRGALHLESESSGEEEGKEQTPSAMYKHSVY